MRKVDDGEKKKIMTFIVATNVVDSRSPERRMLVPIWNFNIMGLNP